MQQAKIVVNGYTDNTPIGPELAREGVTTGISAHDRAHTVAVAIDPTKGMDDIVSPGHFFPLVAKDGGVFSVQDKDLTDCNK